MYKQHPRESFLSKSLKVADQGLKIWGTAQGLYHAGSAIAGGVRTAMQVAGPALAML